MDNESKMAQVSDWKKQELVEELVRGGWKTSAAWQAADDPDNWEETTEDTVQPAVIASSDQYDE